MGGGREGSIKYIAFLRHVERANFFLLSLEKNCLPLGGIRVGKGGKMKFFLSFLHPPPDKSNSSRKGIDK